MRSLRAIPVALLALAASSGLRSAEAQRTDEDVQVDLQPCLLTKVAIAADTASVTEAYVFQEFFKGFWASSQHHIVASNDTALDLTVDGDEYHGRCSVVFVGIATTTEQQATLKAYSQRFQARIVYFDEAQTADDVDIMARLGLSQYFADPLLDIPMIKLTDNADPRVVNPDLRTDPQTNAMFTRGVRQVGSAINGTAAIVADYADANGTSLAVNESGIVYSSVAAMTYLGNDGEEEMHIFFTLAWFDLGSWAWAHYIAEWGTKGMFAGERRFWLGVTVDDLYLETNEFEYDGEYNEGLGYRLGGDQLSTHLAEVAYINSLYNANITTEFSFNANGILEKVNSSYALAFDDADAALLSKGQLPSVQDDGDLGISDIHDEDWWSQETVNAMQNEFEDGSWDADDLLFASISHGDDFYWQSHTMSHLARDDLSGSDCDIEDGANAQIAVIAGLFEHETYDWRSLTTPGITGLFNKNCLTSAADNLMMCAPGDNTYDGVQTNVSLISSVNQFHSIYTTEEEVGFEGFQIVPRFATFVYYNCITTDCLILENLYIRRVTCGCTDPSPGTIDNLNTDTSDCDVTVTCPLGLQALETVENVFETEATTTTRWMLNGRRDKYMFHQANVIPTTVPTGTKSLLDYWYEVVFAKMAAYLNLQGDSPFPVRSMKFDDLCTNFGHHEDLDNSGAMVTMTLKPNGTVSGMNLTSVNATGVIPITIPASMEGSVSLVGLPEEQPYASETYGSDLTYYVATSKDDEPEELEIPSASDLASVPS